MVIRCIYMIIPTTFSCFSSFVLLCNQDKLIRNEDLVLDATEI